MTDIKEQIRLLLMTLWEAERKPGVRAWAIHVALTFAINKDPDVNKRDVWKLIQDEYVNNLFMFPDQREPGQSYRRAAGDAWEMFVEEYLNTNYVLRRSGVKVVRLRGDDFHRFISALGLPDIRVKDVDLFLQGIDESGVARVFGACSPKPVMPILLYFILMGTEENPSVKRQTINRGIQRVLFIFAGPLVHIVRCTAREAQSFILRAWNNTQTYDEEAETQQQQPNPSQAIGGCNAGGGCDVSRCGSDQETGTPIHQLKYVIPYFLYSFSI